MFKNFTGNNGRVNNYIKRILAVILCLCVFAMLSAITVMAADGEGGGNAGAAEGEQPAGLGFLQPILLIGLFGLLMYFMLYRPQKKQERTVAAMRNSLQIGDEISTNGGILGKIIQIKDEFVIIETGNDRTKLKLAKWSIRAVEHREEEEDDDEYEDDDE